MASIAHKVTVNAPQDQLFQALSTLEGLKGWYTPRIEGTAGKNGEAVFSFADEQPFAWKFTEVEPNSLICWKCVKGPGAAAGTTVTFRLSRKGGNRTVVEFDHEGWPEGHAALKTCNTLWGILMGQLKKYAETGQAEPAFVAEATREKEGTQRKHAARS